MPRKGRCRVDRCALFVDASYLLADGAMAVHGTRRRESVSWDYAGLLQLLGNLARERTGLPLLRCYWYEATVEGRRSPEHDALADLPGIKLRLSRIRPGRREGVDTEIHRDLMTLARNGGVADAVVVSGDEDIAQVIADAQDHGVRVSVLHVAVDGNWTISRVLRHECDDLIEIGSAHLRPYVNLLAGMDTSSPPLSNGHGTSTTGGALSPLQPSTQHSSPPPSTPITAPPPQLGGSSTSSSSTSGLGQPPSMRPGDPGAAAALGADALRADAADHPAQARELPAVVEPAVVGRLVVERQQQRPAVRPAARRSLHRPAADPPAAAAAVHADALRRGQGRPPGGSRFRRVGRPRRSRPCGSRPCSRASRECRQTLRPGCFRGPRCRSTFCCMTRCDTPSAEGSGMRSNAHAAYSLLAAGAVPSGEPL